MVFLQSQVQELGGACFQVFSDHPREHLLSSYYQTGQLKLLSCINLYPEVGTIIIPHFIDEERRYTEVNSFVPDYRN